MICNFYHSVAARQNSPERERERERRERERERERRERERDTFACC